MMKKIVIALFILGLVVGGLYYTFSSQSYKYSREAQRLYEKGEYREAFMLADKALRMDTLNRQAIDLRPKLKRIVEGEDMLNEATKLYEDGINKALEGRVEEAKLNLSQAYSIAEKIQGLSPSKPAAKELMKKIERDAVVVLDKAPETQYQTAIKYIGEGKLVRAYEALSNITVESEKVKRKKSELAYQIGMQRFEEASAEETPSGGVVQDSIYWLSNVDRNDENYLDANSKIEILKQMRTR